MAARGPMSQDPEFQTAYSPPRFPRTTESPVRFGSVVLRGAVVGYLWAATTDDAAGFVTCKSVGADAFNASVQWSERLKWAKENGLAPLQVLRHWVGAAEDPKAGAVSGEEQEVANLTELEARAT